MQAKLDSRFAIDTLHRMKPFLRTLALLLCVLTTAHCDRAESPATSPATKSPASATSVPPAKPAPDSLPHFNFTDDQAFATFAASLEPAVHRVQTTGYVTSNQLVRHGTRAIGYRDFKANYVVWTIDPNTGQTSAQFVDAELGEPEDKTYGFSTAAWKFRTSPDGSWGFFPWIDNENLRPELWRLPTKAGDKSQRFHTFASAKSGDLDRASISPDGRWLIYAHEGKPLLFSVDAAAGKVQPVEFTLPAEFSASPTQRVYLSFAGHGMKIAARRMAGVDKALGGNHHTLAIGSIQLDNANLQATVSDLHWLIGNPQQSREIMAMSPDGQWMLVRYHNSSTNEPASLWRWPERGKNEAQMVAALPHIDGSGSVYAQWSPDGQRLAIGMGNQVYVYRNQDLAAGQPFHHVSLSWSIADLGFSEDGSHVITLARNGFVTNIPLNQPREVKATIGLSLITWNVPGQAPTSDRWPSLAVTSTIKHGEGGVPPTLIAQVTNQGTGPAEQVRATLTIAPPLSASNEAEAASPLANLKTFHFGTVVDGSKIQRVFDLPSDPALFNHARRFSLTVRSKYDFNPAPIHWLHLPRTLQNEEEYHALARKIFEASSAILARTLGEHWKEPTLVPMGPQGYGFMVSLPRTVLYQNPFQMSEPALRINRGVMQVDSKDALMRHAQMMLYWYIPHELAHCSDHRRGWATEFVANMIQPYLTARMLESMPDAPYSAQTMAFVYDHYVQTLRPHLSTDDIARIEHFIQNDGQGTAPWDMSASEVFHSNTPAYVYFGARINQHAWSKQLKLEDLCKHYYISTRPTTDQ